MTKETRGLALIAGIYFLLFVIPHFIHFSYGNQSLRMIIPLLAYIFLALFGLYVLRYRLKENLSWIKQHKLKSLGITLLVFLAMTLFTIAGSFLAQFDYSFFNIDQSNLTNDTNIGSAMNLFPVPLLILVLGVLGPFVEEIIYRYILLNFFKKYCSVGVAIFLSSLCFAMIHVNHFTANELLGVLPHFMSGIVFAYTYYKTDNLLFSSAVHISNNTSIFLLI